MNRCLQSKIRETEVEEKNKFSVQEEEEEVAAAVYSVIIIMLLMSDFGF
jgi:hypothetical protein